MAPRRRPRKVGLRRMDAAYDAMAPLGFSKELVRRKVKDLLQVYEGDVGWAFIEEASYKLLIDTILEEQENCEEEKHSSMDELHHEGPIGDSEDVASAAGTSSAVPEVNTFEETTIGEGGPKLVTVNTSREVLDEPTSTGLYIDSKRTGEVPDEPKLLTNDTSSAVPISGDRNTDSKETGLEEVRPVSKEAEGSTQISLHNLRISSAEKKLLCSHPQVISSPLSLNIVPSNRRRRYHGWISSNDDEEDVITVGPPLLPPSAYTIGDIESWIERKSGWDVRPDDL